MADTPQPDNASVMADFIEMAQKLSKIKAERDELTALNNKLSDLLRRTAIALKGPEPELVAWDWSDLPECAGAQRDMIIRAINGAIRRHHIKAAEG